MTDFSQSQATVSKGRMLVVDDEAKLRNLMGQIIRQEGYLVDEASNGEQALELLKRTCYDLMTVDMSMPGMSGVEVVHHARQLRPDLSIIIVTAHPTVESAIMAVKSDVTDYLLKPCTADDLLLTISKAMQERAKQQKRQRLLEMVSAAMDTLRETEGHGEQAPAAQTNPVPAAPPEDCVRVGSLALDRPKRLVTVHSDPPRTVELTEGEVSILLTLMEKPNEVFTYNQLADTALGYKDMDKWTIESVVRSSVFRLRQKIEVGSGTPNLIRTVRGRGYFLSAA